MLSFRCNKSIARYGHDSRTSFQIHGEARSAQQKIVGLYRIPYGSAMQVGALQSPKQLKLRKRVKQISTATIEPTTQKIPEYFLQQALENQFVSKHQNENH